MLHTLGVDIGGVLVGRREENITAPAASYLDEPEVAGAFESLRVLRDQLFGERIYLISKCGEKTQRQTLEWLEHHRFFEITGISRDHVLFCRKRHEKAVWCDVAGVTCFVDDRLEVLSYLETVPLRFLINGMSPEIERFRQHLKGTIQVVSWHELTKVLLARCAQNR
jgi:hypothetical protein